MAEAAGMHFIEHLFPGMSKRRVPQIMPQRNGLCQIFIEPQGPGNGAGNLGNLQRMGQPGAVMVSLRG